MNYKRITILFYFLVVAVASNAQLTQGDSIPKLINSAVPVEYQIGGVVVSGADHFDEKVLILLSGLTIGDKVQVPGEKFSTAIENLWKQGLFGDVKIVATKIQGNYIFLKIEVTERPRIFKFAIRGVKKSEADDIRDKVGNSIKGKVATEGLIASTQQKVKKFFVNKGYM